MSKQKNVFMWVILVVVLLFVFGFAKKLLNLFGITKEEGDKTDSEQLAVDTMPPPNTENAQQGAGETFTLSDAESVAQRAWTILGSDNLTWYLTEQEWLVLYNMLYGLNRDALMMVFQAFGTRDSRPWGDRMNLFGFFDRQLSEERKRVMRIVFDRSTPQYV